MRAMNRKTASAALALLVLLPLAASAGTQPALWTSRFESAEGIVHRDAYPDGLQLLSAGDSLFAYDLGEGRSGDPALIRLRPDNGERIWSAIGMRIPDSGSRTRKLVIANDGSTYMLGDNLDHFHSDGAFAWSAPGSDIRDVVLVDPENLLVVAAEGSTMVVRRMSSADGSTREAVRLASQAVCTSASMVAGGAQDAYLSCGSRITRILLAPLRAGWAVPGEGGTLAIDPARANLYEWSASSLRKRSPTDGNPIWNAVSGSGSIRHVAFDVEGNIVTSGPEVSRWDAGTGARLWHVDEPGIAIPDKVDHSVFVAGTRRAAPATGGTYMGMLGKLELQSGAMLWNRETGPDTWNWFGALSVVGNTVHLTGASCTYVYANPCVATSWTADKATGTLSAGRPLIVQAATSIHAASIAAGDRTHATALEWDTGGARIHLRQLDNNTGSIVDESTIGIPHGLAGWTSDFRLGTTRASPDRLAATYSRDWLGSQYLLDDATVLMAVPSTGQVLWQKFLTDNDKVGAISAPVADSAGNITVGIVERESIFPNEQTRRWLRQYARESGLLLWEREVASFPFNADQLFAPRVLRTGDCLLTWELFVSGDGGADGLKCLSANDGSVRWSSTSIRGSIVSLDATTALAVGNTTASLTWQKFDLATGEILWETSHVDASIASYSIIGTISGDGDAIYTGGTVRLTGQATPAQVRGIAFRLDADDGQIIWTKRLDDNPVGATSRFYPRMVKDGKVYGTQRIAGDYIYGFALTALSTMDGEAQGSGFLYQSDYEQPHLPERGDQGVLGLTGNGAMLVWGSQKIPGSPSEFEISNWGEPLPGAAGALAVELSVLPSSAGDMVDLAFAAETRNNGSVDAARVQTSLRLPDGAIVRDLACSTNGLPCTTAVIAAAISGEFAIPAGQTLRISGVARVLPTSTPPHFSAYAYGLHPFFEMDLKDNATTLQVDFLFRNGFEAAASP